MKRKLSVLLVVVMMAMCFSSYGAAATVSEAIVAEFTEKVSFDAEYTEDEILVCVNMEKHDYTDTLTVDDFPEVDIDSVEELFVTEKCQIVLLHLSNSGKDEVCKAIESLAMNNIVDSADPNYCDFELTATANDRYFEDQYALALTSVDDAWNYETGLSTVKVGIVDSGIAAHPDLNANLTTGWDIHNGNATTTDDVVNHGTHVAGIVGAVGNNVIGVSGVCQDITLVPLQLNSYGEIPSTYVVDAIKYAKDNDIQILNMSFQNPSYSSALETAINGYSGLVVCAAGNNGQNNDIIDFYPANYPCDNLISVASSNANDALSSFSNYGVTSVDLVAPGEGIWSTMIGNSYGTSNGTSMAAPMVTGVAALLLSYNSNMTAYQIKHAILDNVDPVASLSGKVLTGGRLNAKAAIETVLSGDQVKSYKTALRITSISGTIGYAYANFNYNRSLANYVGFSKGPVIPSGSSVSNVVGTRVLLSCDYLGNGINSTGLFIAAKFNSPFKSSCLSSLSLYDKGFYDSNYNTVTTGSSYVEVLVGDVNLDGNITSADSTLVAQYVSGSATLTTTKQLAADVNDDGTINSMDSIWISQYVSGTRTGFWS